MAAALREHLSLSSSSRMLFRAHTLSNCGYYGPTGIKNWNEDRYIVEEWTMANGTWTFAAIFDGHGGPDAAEFALQTLPSLVKDSLVALKLTENAHPDNQTVGRLISEAVVATDLRIEREFTSLLSAGVEVLSDQEILAAITCSDGVAIRPEALRAVSGTTASIALIDPFKGVHLANLGDCDAVLYVPNASGTGWKGQVLSAHHNCENKEELERVKQEHIGEPHCVDHSRRFGRVLGSIVLTRALGDMPLKLPSIYNLSVFPLTRDNKEVNQNLVDYNLTPPYLSHIPEVSHAKCDRLESTFLIMASDGLLERFKKVKPERSEMEILDYWVSVASKAQHQGENMALDLLWEAFGGDSDGNIYTMVLDKSLQDRVDDITIIVIPL
ncbi:protein serine/threonine phosphatase 2C [Gymnopus androsaceus JB14]|uniref:Protein serine/threonine phosphatase 2C n=1 Tax=Gymnopus androsaceus JB14 TaxID=1447944 RepID=A0A6A4GE48_9AGAR|nr:protein serine/threonine phosphatase 2C [Gymnopus androsaceus JB14]